MAKKINPKNSQPSDIEAKLPSGTQEIILGGFGTLLYGDGNIDANQLLQKSNESLFGKKNSLFGKVNNILSLVTSVIPEANGRRGVNISGVKPEVFEKFNESLVKSFNDKYKLDKYQDFWIKMFEQLVQKLTDELDPDNIKVKTSEKSSNVKTSGQIDIVISGTGDLSKLIETLEKNEFKISDDVKKSFNNLVEITKSLSELNKKSLGNVDNVKKIISDLTKIFNDDQKDKESLIKLFKSIGALNNDPDIIGLEFDNVKAAMEVVANSVKLFDQNLNVDNKIDKKIKKLAELFVNDGPIENLIKSLINTSQLVESRDISESIDVLDDFFKMISTLGDIKLRYLFRSKASIKFIKIFLVEDVKNLIEKVKEFESIDKDMHKSFDALNSFFNSIKILGEIGSIEKRRMRNNIRFINKYLTSDFYSIFKTLQQLADKNSDEMKTIASIKDVIEAIFKIGEIDNKKKKDIKKGTKFIKKFVKNNLKNLFDTIRENLKTEDQDKGALLKRVEYAEDILDNITKLNETSLPKTGDAIKSLIKVGLLIAESNEIGVLISDIKEWKQLSKTQESNLKEKLPSYITSILDINTMILRSFDNKILKTLFQLHIEILELQEVLNQLRNLNNVIKKELKFTRIKTTLNNLHEVFDLIKDDYNEEINKLNGLWDLIFNIKSILGILLEDKEIESDVDTAITIIENSIIPFVERLKENETLDKAFENLFKIDKDALTKIDTMISIIKKLDTLSKVAAISKLSNIGLTALETSADKIQVIIDKLSSIKEEDLEKAQKSIKAFSLLVAMSAMVLILGSMAMALVNVGDLILFTVSLSVFLYALTGVFKLIGDSLNESIDGAKDAVILVAGAAFVMIFGGIMMQYVDPGNLVIFTITLAAFLTGVGLVFRLFHKGFEKSMEGAKDAVILVGGAAIIMIFGSMLMPLLNIVNLSLFIITLSAFLFGIGLVFLLFHKGFENAMDGAKDAVILVGGAAAILLFGGLIMHFVNYADLILFTVTLGLFIWAVASIFLLFNQLSEDAIKGAHEASILIVVSGATLLVGSLLMKVIDFADLALFTVTLGLFILSVAGIFLLFNKLSDNAIKGAREASILIVVSGAILILGGLAMKYIDYGDLILFTVTLGLFLLALTGIFLLFNKVKDTAIKSAIAAAVFVALSALVLLVGAYILMENPDLWWNALVFIGLVAIYSLAVIGIAYLLNKNQGKIWGAVLVMIVMGAITLLMAYVLQELVITANLITDWEQLLATLGTMVAIIGVLLAIAFIIGNPEIVGYILAGEVALVAMVAIVWLLGKAVSSLAEAMEDIARVSHADIDLMNLINLIVGFYALAGPMSGLGALLPVIGLAAGSMLALKKFLYDAADIVEKFASLKIPIYEGDKIVGYNIMKKSDFAVAAGNIKSIIETLFKTVKDIYDEHPEMFDFSLSSLFTGGSIFSKVARAGITMSTMLSKIAKTVQLWADLKIPIYEGTKIAGYETITSDAFIKAAGNIKEVVLTLGKAVIDTYDYAVEKGYGDMFEVSFGDLFTGGSKFSKVARSLKTMGPMLSSIASAIKDWAKLTIPVYEGTKVVGYETITGEMFPKASENIKQVVLTLGKAVIETYDYAVKKGYGDMFEVNNLADLLTGGSKFSKVARSLKTMGPMLSSIAKAIKDWAKLTIPIYEGAKVVGYETITSQSFVTAAKNIQKVIITLGSAIIGTYWAVEKNEKTKGMFEETEFLGLTVSKSPFGKVVKAFRAMGPMLSSIAWAIKEWVDLKIPIYKDGKIVDYHTITSGDFDTAAKNIEEVLVCIGKAMIQTVDGHEEIFSDVFGDSSPAKRAAEAMKVMGETLVLTATAVGAYASGKFPIFDAQGNYVKDLDIDLNKKVNFTDIEGNNKNGSLLEAASANIQRVLVCIGKALVQVVDDPNNGDIFDDGLFTKSKAAVAAEAIKNMSDALNNTVTAIQKLAELKLDDLIAALDPNGAKDNIYHKLVNLLTFTSDIALLFLKPDAEKYGKTTDYLLWGGNAMSFAEFLDDTHDDVKDAADALETFATTLSNLLTSVGNLGNTYKQNISGINQLENIYSDVKTTMFYIRDIVNYLSSDINKEFYKNINRSKTQIEKGLDSSTTIINNLLQNLETIKTNYEKIANFELNDLKNLIVKFGNCVRALNFISANVLITGNEGLQKAAAQLNVTKITSDLKLYTDVIERIVKIAEYSQEVGEEGYNILRDGILKLYFTTSIIDENEAFRKTTDDLERYIRAINSIDLSRITRLTGLVDAMNELSSRLGNLDNLTEAISDKLSVVLLELVNQLRFAEATINNAHELQEKRKKLIEASVETVKQIMNQPMVVEIKQTDPEKPDEDPQKFVDGKPVNNTPENNETDKIPKNLIASPSPEEPQPNNQRNRNTAKQRSNSDVLTRTEFQNMMAENFQGWKRT